MSSSEETWDDGSEDGLHGIWDYPVRTAQWEEIENVVQDHLKTAPPGWESGFFFSYAFVGKDLQDAMRFILAKYESLSSHGDPIHAPKHS